MKKSNRLSKSKRKSKKIRRLIDQSIIVGYAVKRNQKSPALGRRSRPEGARYEERRAAAGSRLKGVTFMNNAGEGPVYRRMGFPGARVLAASAYPERFRIPVAASARRVLPPSRFPFFFPESSIPGSFPKKIVRENRIGALSRLSGGRPVFACAYPDQAGGLRRDRRFT